MSDKKKDKIVFFLPNTFTALNMGCGFLAILYAVQGDFYKACVFIIVGALFDSVDGRVARLTGTQSSFGEQFDSLSDLISFGVAPAMIFYFKFLSHLNKLGMIIGFFFMLCGALRLARFNANIEKVSSDFFQGLPIPGAATAIIGFILISLELQFESVFKLVAIPYILFYSVLMISNIPFPSFKSSDWIKRNKRKVFFLILLIISSTFVWVEGMLFIIITTYVLSSVIYRLTHKNKMKDIFNWEEGTMDEES